MDYTTPDGFTLTDDERDMMSLLDNNELRTRMIESAIELGIREELPALTQVMGFIYGCLHRSRMPLEEGHPPFEAIEMVYSIIGMLLTQFRRSFPNEHSLTLMPIVDPDGDNLEILAVIAQGENAKVLWKHSRAAHEELGSTQVEVDVLDGGPGGPDCNEMWDHLDELCGYHGVNFDELDFDKLLGGGE